MTADAPTRTHLTSWRQSGLPDAHPDEIPGGGLHRGVVLPAARSSAHNARAFTAATLADWRLNGLADDVTVCVSELVTNATRHATGHVELTLHLLGRTLWVHVGDADPNPPVPQSALDEAGDLLAESGRGLDIVGKLASGRTWTPAAGDGGGKVVSCWFLLDGGVTV